jgi:multidrug resistance efflux pump
MEPTNGNSTTSRQALDTLRQAIANLEADLAKQEAEAKQLRAERDEYRAVIYDHLKKQFGDPSVWDDFDPKDYTLTIDDLVKIIRSK